MIIQIKTRDETVREISISSACPGIILLIKTPKAVKNAENNIPLTGTLFLLNFLNILGAFP